MKTCRLAPYYVISEFRDREDAEAAAAAGRDAAGDKSVEVVVDKPDYCRMYCVSLDEYIGRANQRAVRAIKLHAARIEINDSDRASCGNVHGKRMDPRVYLDGDT